MTGVGIHNLLMEEVERGLDGPLSAYWEMDELPDFVEKMQRTDVLPIETLLGMVGRRATWMGPIPGSMAIEDRWPDPSNALLSMSMMLVDVAPHLRLLDLQLLGTCISLYSHFRLFGGTLRGFDQRPPLVDAAIRSTAMSVTFHSKPHGLIISRVDSHIGDLSWYWIYSRSEEDGEIVKLEA